MKEPNPGKEKLCDVSRTSQSGVCAESSDHFSESVTQLYRTKPNANVKSVILLPLLILYEQPDAYSVENIRELLD
jgi:hypothetical protein